MELISASLFPHGLTVTLLNFPDSTSDHHDRLRSPTSTHPIECEQAFEQQPSMGFNGKIRKRGEPSGEDQTGKKQVSSGDSYHKIFTATCHTLSPLASPPPTKITLWRSPLLASGCLPCMHIDGTPCQPLVLLQLVFIQQHSPVSSIKSFHQS